MTEPLFAKLRELYKETNPHGTSVWSSDAELNKDAILIMATYNALPKLFAALDLMEEALKDISSKKLRLIRGSTPPSSDIAYEALAKVREMEK